MQCVFGELVACVYGTGGGVGRGEITHKTQRKEKS